MKNSPTANANAFAVTIGIFYVACRILVFLFPGLLFSIAQTWFHGIALTEGAPTSLTLSAFVLGLISSVVAAWFSAYLFLYIRNLMKS